VLSNVRILHEPVIGHHGMEIVAKVEGTAHFHALRAALAIGGKIVRKARTSAKRSVRTVFKKAARLTIKSNGERRKL